MSGGDSPFVVKELRPLRDGDDRRRTRIVYQAYTVSRAISVAITMRQFFTPPGSFWIESRRQPSAFYVRP